MVGTRVSKRKQLSVTKKGARSANIASASATLAPRKATDFAFLGGAHFYILQCNPFTPASSCVQGGEGHAPHSPGRKGGVGGRLWADDAAARPGYAVPWAPRACAPAFFLPPHAQIRVPRLIPTSGWGKILPAVAAPASSLISSSTCQSHRRSSGSQKARNHCSLYQERSLRSWPLPPFTFEDSAQMSLLDLTTSPTAAHAPSRCSTLVLLSS